MVQIKTNNSQNKPLDARTTISVANAVITNYGPFASSWVNVDTLNGTLRDWYVVRDSDRFQVVRRGRYADELRDLPDNQNLMLVAYNDFLRRIHHLGRPHRSYVVETYNYIPIRFGLSSSTGAIVGFTLGIAAHERMAITPNDLAYIATAIEQPTLRIGREDSMGVAHGGIGVVTPYGFYEKLEANELPEIAFIIGIHPGARKQGTALSREVLQNARYSKRDVIRDIAHKITCTNYLHLRGLGDGAVEGLVEEVVRDAPDVLNIDQARELQYQSLELLLRYNPKRSIGEEYRIRKLIEHLPHDILQEPVRIEAGMNAPLTLEDLHLKRKIAEEKGGAYTIAGASGADVITLPRSLVLNPDGSTKEDVFNSVKKELSRVYANRGLERKLFEAWVAIPIAEGARIVDTIPEVLSG